MDVIRAVCGASDSRDPYEIALAIMRAPSVNLHGPEHHVIVGASLATAFRNVGGASEPLEKLLDIIEKRGKNVPGGTCGFWGACGAALGAGIFLSAATGATPLSAESQGLCNRLTARCLAAIGEIGGPRCCKRNLALAIRETVAFTRENLGVDMAEGEIVCEFYKNNKECIGARCPFRAAK
jgi:hypothetical protein